MCSDYVAINVDGKVTTLSVTILISLINIGIRTLNKILIVNIGYKKKSQEVRSMMQYIFYTQYFNTGFIFMLANSNFDYRPILKHLQLANKGQFPDFLTSWHLIVGPAIVQTMAFHSVFPIFNFLIFYLLRVLLRAWDSNCRCFSKKHRTKTTTV